VAVLAGKKFQGHIPPLQPVVVPPVKSVGTIFNKFSKGTNEGFWWAEGEVPQKLKQNVILLYKF